MKETTMPNKDQRDLDKLDFLFHEVALTEAERGFSNRDELRHEREMHASVQAKIAERRRQRFDAVVVPEPTSLPPIPSRLMTWTRDVLLARIARLAETEPGAVQYAHKDLSGLSDNDLRRLVQLLEDHDEEAR